MNSSTKPPHTKKNLFSDNYRRSRVYAIEWPRVHGICVRRQSNLTLIHSIVQPILRCSKATHTCFQGFTACTCRSVHRWIHTCRPLVPLNTRNSMISLKYCLLHYVLRTRWGWGGWIAHHPELMVLLTSNMAVLVGSFLRASPRVPGFMGDLSLLDNIPFAGFATRGAPEGKITTSTTYW